MNESRCEDCGALWYSASEETAGRPCQECGGRVSLAGAPPTRARRFRRATDRVEQRLTLIRNP